MATLLHKTKIKKPDAIELGLVIVLAIWSLSVLWLLERVITAQTMELLSWMSLIAFFAGFASVIVVVIAILVADIRKEIKELY